MTLSRSTKAKVASLFQQYIECEDKAEKRRILAKVMRGMRVRAKANPLINIVIDELTKLKSAS